MTVNPSGQASPDRVAAVRLATALADALNPAAGAEDAMIARSLLHPLCVRTIDCLAANGWALTPAPGDASA